MATTKRLRDWTGVTSLETSNESMEVAFDGLATMNESMGAANDSFGDANGIRGWRDFRSRGHRGEGTAVSQGGFSKSGGARRPGPEKGSSLRPERGRQNFPSSSRLGNLPGESKRNRGGGWYGGTAQPAACGPECWRAECPPRTLALSSRQRGWGVGLAIRQSSIGYSGSIPQSPFAGTCLAFLA